MSEEKALVSDRVRQGLTVVGAVAQVAMPTLLLPRVRRTIEPPDVVQPAPWTCPVWLPIYATSLAYAAHQARPAQRTDPVLREIGWPLGVAFAINGIWAPLVATRRYWAAQSALVEIGAAAGIARRRLTAAEREGRVTRGLRRYAVAPTAGLSAWGTAAAAVNLASVIAAYAPVRGRRATDILAVATMAVVGAASTLAVRGAGPASPTATCYGATVLWAVVGVAAGQRRRSRPAAHAAVGAAVPLVAALVRARL